MIAAAIAALGFASGALAQKDAAEKAMEGGIDHWIEYYKSGQRKPTAASPREGTVGPVNPTAPVDPVGPDTLPKGNPEQK